ncbi:MAG: hypothetical protein HZA95_00240, partial [Candidatus Vogelbacteria bacterium]|nr:hypothetical protein [Candidatus Vogelbacteria bacterium]
YRGRIASVAETEDGVKFSFSWLAKNRGGPMGSVKPMSLEWDVVTPSRDYAISRDLVAVSDVGAGRVAINSMLTGELAVFFLSDGSAMNPEHIHGLDPILASEQRMRHEQWEASR